MSEKKLVTFLDNVERTIIGNLVAETDEVMQIENPVVIHVVPQQDPATGQMKMSLQLFPIFFREFLADANAPVVWEYKKAHISMPTEMPVFDFKLHAQYANLFANIQAQPQVAPAPASQPKTDNVIKLFD